MKIHYDLIGTIPEVECFGNSLDEIILRYEMTNLEPRPQFGLMNQADLKQHIATSFNDSAALTRMADAVAIELCAEHFYGLRGADFNTMSELIDAINSIEQGNRFK